MSSFFALRCDVEAWRSSERDAPSLAVIVPSTPAARDGTFVQWGPRRVVATLRAVRLEVYADAEAVAEAGAAIIATEIRAAVAARGRCVMAISGGRTPWLMLRLLAAEDLPWKAVHLVQVDERVAPGEHPDRNFSHISEILRAHPLLESGQVVPMPVAQADLAAGAAAYARALAQLAGTPPVLDLVHLGLGADGHTASLVPGDPVLEVDAADVAITQPYQKRRRMTLTYPILNRARSILWVVTGSNKTQALARLREGDRSIPAGRVRTDHALVLADRTAAGARGPKY